MATSETPPILRDKHYDALSAFTPESLLREARRQKGADKVAVPKTCLLDPDGDIVRYLNANDAPESTKAGSAITPTCGYSRLMATRSALWRVLWVLPLPYWWPRSCLPVDAPF